MSLTRLGHARAAAAGHAPLRRRVPPAWRRCCSRSRRSFAVLRGCCRCCRAGATMQDLLLQLSMQKAPEQTLVLEESHRGVHGPGDSRQDASREVGVEKTLSEVAARWLLSSGWCCSTCYRSRLTILGTLRRTFSDDPNEPPLAPSRLAHPWPGCVQAAVDAAVLHRWHVGHRDADRRLSVMQLRARDRDGMVID